MKKKVVYIQPLHPSGMKKLEEKYDVVVVNSEDKDVLKKEIVDAHAIISRLTVIDKELISAGEKLQAIAKHGIGVDNIDVKYATEQGIVVLTTGNANSLSVAEHAFFAMGSLFKRINYFDAQMRCGNWKSRDTEGSYDVTGKKLGIIGFGNIGSCLASMSQQGFNMDVGIYDPYAEKEVVEVQGYKYYEDLDELCRVSDVISIHVPLTDSTRNLIDKRRIGLMKPNAYIINFARGGIVNEQDLYDALANKRIAGAALDAFSQEPLNMDNPLLKLDNVLLSPHCGTFSEDSRIRMSMQVAEGVEDVLEGRVPKFAANKKEIYKY